MDKHQQAVEEQGDQWYLEARAVLVVFVILLFILV